MKFLRLKAFLIRVLTPDKKTIGAIGDDVRKVAITAISVGIVGCVVTSDTISTTEALIVLGLGIILWVYGVILTKYSNS